MLSSLAHRLILIVIPQFPVERVFVRVMELGAETIDVRILAFGVPAHGASAALERPTPVLSRVLWAADTEHLPGCYVRPSAPFLVPPGLYRVGGADATRRSSPGETTGRRPRHVGYGSNILFSPGRASSPGRLRTA